MPSDGQRWHEIRSGYIDLKSCDLHEVIITMMKPLPQDRPSAASLLDISVLINKLL